MCLLMRDDYLSSCANLFLILSSKIATGHAPRRITRRRTTAPEIGAWVIIREDDDWRIISYHVTSKSPLIDQVR